MAFLYSKSSSLELILRSTTILNASPAFGFWLSDDNKTSVKYSSFWKNDLTSEDQDHIIEMVKEFLNNLTNTFNNLKLISISLFFAKLLSVAI